MSNARGNPGKKRYNSQPLEGASKDARNDVSEMDSDALRENNLPTWSQVAERGQAQGTTGGSMSFATSNRFGPLAQSNSYPDKSMRSASVTSRGSRRGSKIGIEPNRGATALLDEYQRYLPREDVCLISYMIPSRSGPSRSRRRSAPPDWYRRRNCLGRSSTKSKSEVIPRTNVRS